MREPLLLGTLNDGIEPQYPTTDVPALLPFVQGFMGQELDRNLHDQAPDDWFTTQHGTLGIGVSPLVKVASTPWVVPLSTWQKTPDNLLLSLRVTYQGCQMTWMTCKRPAPAHSEMWPQWDRNLARVVADEKSMGYLPVVGMDTNESAPMSLAATTRLRWSASYNSSKVGFLFHPHIFVLVTTSLVSTGEHAPVLSMVRVPVS